MKDRLVSMRTRLDVAKSEWKLRHVDDSHVDFACESLMFSIELGIKQLIVLNGNVPPKTHNIKPLLTSLPEKYYKSDWYQLLNKWKEQTNEWYNESRYSDNFSAVNNAVEDYMTAAEELLQDADSNISYMCDTETRVAKILNKLNSTRPVSDVIRYLPDADLPESILFDLVVEILNNKR